MFKKEVEWLVVSLKLFLLLLSSFVVITIFLTFYIPYYLEEKEKKYELEKAKEYYDTYSDFMHVQFDHTTNIKNYKYMFYVDYDLDSKEYNMDNIVVKINSDGIEIYKKGKIYEKINMEYIDNYVMKYLRPGTHHSYLIVDGYEIWVDDQSKMTIETKRCKILMQRIKYSIKNKVLLKLEMELYMK